jgi:hypothetical protein
VLQAVQSNQNVMKKEAKKHKNKIIKIRQDQIILKLVAE